MEHEQQRDVFWEGDILSCSDAETLQEPPTGTPALFKTATAIVTKNQQRVLPFFKPVHLPPLLGHPDASLLQGPDDHVQEVQVPGTCPLSLLVGLLSF